MPLNSGTPAKWLSGLSEKVVNVHCECSAEVAAERFVHRKRHPGHLDNNRSHAEILASIRGVASLGRLDITPRIIVDTSVTPSLEAVLRQVRRALTL
jgi:hypothetical protein